MTKNAFDLLAAQHGPNKLLAMAMLEQQLQRQHTQEHLEEEEDVSRGPLPIAKLQVIRISHHHQNTR